MKRQIKEPIDDVDLSFLYPDSLVKLQEPTSKTVIVCPHAIGGTVAFYRKLVPLIGQGPGFYALQARGLWAGTQPLDTVDEMVAAYCESLSRALDGAAVQVCGYSFGATIALGMQRTLEAAGVKCHPLLLVAPTAGVYLHGEESPALNEVRLHREVELLLDAFFKREQLVVTESTRQRLQLVYETNFVAGNRHRILPGDEQLTLLHPTDVSQAEVARIDAAWQNVTSRPIFSRVIEGKHASIMYEPSLAGELRATTAGC